MTEQFEVNRYMIMRFDRNLDTLIQYSVSMSLENCRRMIAVRRKNSPTEEYSIVAVLDE